MSKPTHRRGVRGLDADGVLATITSGVIDDFDPDNLSPTATSHSPPSIPVTVTEADEHDGSSSSPKLVRKTAPVKRDLWPGEEDVSTSTFAAHHHARSISTSSLGGMSTGSVMTNNPKKRNENFEWGVIETYTCDDIVSRWTHENLSLLTGTFQFQEQAINAAKKIFEEQQVDGQTLLQLNTDEDLRRIGFGKINEHGGYMCYGERVRLLERIDEVRSRQGTAWEKMSMDQKVTQPCLLTIATLAVGYLLIYLRFIMVPLVMAVFVAYWLQPIVDLLCLRPLVLFGNEPFSRYCRSTVFTDYRGKLVSCGCGHPEERIAVKTAKELQSADDSVSTNQLEIAADLAFYKALERKKAGDRRVGGFDELSVVGAAKRYIAKRVLLLQFPRWMAVCTAFLLFFLLCYAMGMLVAFAAKDVTSRWNLYQHRIDEITNSTKDLLYPYVDVDQMLSGKSDPCADPSSTATLVISILGTVFSILADVFLVFLFATYLLMERKDFLDDDTADMKTLKEIDESIKSYINLKVLISVITAFGSGSVLFCLGVDLYPLWAMFVFLFNFIPNIGSVVVTFLPLPIIILQPDMTLLRGVLAIMIPGTWQFFVGNMLEPIVFGDKFDMHAVTVLVGLILWGTMWGIVGAILSVPIIAVLMIVIKSSKHPAAKVVIKVLRGKFTSESDQDEKEDESEENENWEKFKDKCESCTYWIKWKLCCCCCCNRSAQQGRIGTHAAAARP